MLINSLSWEVTEKLVDVDKSYVRAAAIQNGVLKSLAEITATNQQEAQILATKRLLE